MFQLYISFRGELPSADTIGVLVDPYRPPMRPLHTYHDPFADRHSQKHDVGPLIQNRTQPRGTGSPGVVPFRSSTLPTTNVFLRCEFVLYNFIVYTIEILFTSRDINHNIRCDILIPLYNLILFAIFTNIRIVLHNNDINLTSLHIAMFSVICYHCRACRKYRPVIYLVFQF